MATRAATLYWDGNDTTANADGGTGTWGGATTNWDSALSNGSAAAWASSPADTAILGGTAGTITLGANVTVAGLTASVDNYIIAGGGFTLTSGGVGLITATGSLTINAPLTMSANQTWSAASGKTLTVAGTVTGGGFTLTKTGAGTLALNGTLSGVGAVVTDGTAGNAITLGSAANVSFASLNTGGSAARINVTSAGTLNVSGSFFINNNTAAAAAFTQTAGTVNLTSGTDDGFTGSVGIAARAAATVQNNYNLQGGTLNVLNTALYMAIGGGANGRLNITGGTANLLGLKLSGASTSAVGALSLTGGRLNLGATGLQNGATTSASSTVTLGAGTLGAFANWSSSRAMTLSDAATGVTLDTLDSVDGVTGRTITLTGALSGSGSLRKQGAGTLALGAANTFTGGSTLSAGTLLLSHQNALQSSTLALSGGTLAFDSAVAGNAFTLGGLSGSGSLSLLNNAGTPAAVTLTVGGNNAGTTYSGSITGGSLLKSGSGTLTLDLGAHSLVQLTATGGAVAVTGGSLSTSSTVSLQTAGLTVSAGSVSLARLVTSDANATTTTLTLGGGLLEVTGTNSTDSTAASLLLGHWTSSSTTLALSGGELRSLGANLLLGWDSQVTVNHSAGTANLLGIRLGPTRNVVANYNLTGGRLNLGANGVVSTAANKTLSFGQATVGALADWSSSQGISLTSASGTTFDTADASTGAARTITLNGALSGSGKLTKTGNGVLVLGAANGFSGGVALGQGTLRVANNAALGVGALTLSGGVLSSASSTGYSLANDVTFGGDATLGDATNNGALTFGGAVGLGASQRNLTVASAVTFAGAVSGSAGFTKSGNGTLTLSAANASLGGTVEVAQGSLVLSGNGTLGNAGITLANGILDLGGKAISNTITLTGGTLSGASSYSGNLTLSAGSSLTLANAGDLGTSAVNLSGGTLNLNAKAASNAITLAGGTLTGASAYTGTVSVTADSTIGGTIGGTFGTGTSPSRVVTLSGGTATFTGTLKGVGTLSGDVIVTGAHTPGNSPGIQTISGDLTYSGTPTVTWELTGNTSASLDAGVSFDRIVVSGDLNFSVATALTLVFDGAGSDVNWTNAFWNTARSWLIYDVSGATISFGNLTITGSSFDNDSGLMLNNTVVDSTSAALNDIRADARFYLAKSGEDVRLYYRPIPEPSTYGLMLGGLALAGAALRRRRKKD